MNTLTHSNVNSAPRTYRNRATNYLKDINLETYPDFLDDLSQWKDRTQTAATTTLSIVQIALLRDVLEGGPDHFQYYTAAIVVLSICLALEILSGFLLITLHILRSKSRMLSDGSRRHQGKKTQVAALAAVAEEDTRDGTRGNFARDILYEHDIEYLLDNPSVLDEELRKFPSTCCGLWQPTIDHLLVESAELLDRKVSVLRLKHLSLSGDQATEADNELQRLIAKKEIIMEYLTNMNSRTAYNRIVKLQTVITYMFYLLSILNIFVAVFGVNQYVPLSNVKCDSP